MEDRRIVVVGAGIIGLCSAYELSLRGVKVVVVDRCTTFDSASCGNAGLFSIGHSPLTKPGASWRGLRMMFDSRSPLWIRPSLSPELLRWLYTFHRHCTQAHLDRCLRTLCAMGWQTVEALEAMLDRESIDCLYQRNGWLDLIRDESNLADAMHEAKSIAPYGYHTDFISGRELRHGNPIYRDEIAGAIHYVDSAIVHPGRLVRGLAAALTRRGVEIRTNSSVTGLARDGSGRCVGAQLATGEVVAGTTTVLAAGIWSDELARAAGVRIAMQPARGYHMQIDGLARLPCTGGIMREVSVPFTPMGSQLRLAGTLEIAPVGRPWMRTRIDALLTGARKYFHGIEHGHVTQEWAGYRPCTADGMPVIGAVAQTPGLYVATGHAMMGLTLGPITGRIVAADLCGEPQSIDEEILRTIRPRG